MNFSGSDIGWYINLSMGITGLCVILLMVFVLRWKYQRDIDPSKKAPYGKLVAEFRNESGTRDYVLVEILANGFEVKVPDAKGVKSPRYFFGKSDVGRTLYPRMPMFPTKLLQIEAPMVSWYRDCSEAIPASLSGFAPLKRPTYDQLQDDPDRDTALLVEGEGDIEGDSSADPRFEKYAKIVWMRPSSIMTAEMHDMVRDTGSLEAALAVDDQFGKELEKARATQINKMYVYIGLVAASVCAAGGAVFAYRAYDVVSRWGGGGIAQ